MTRRTQCHHRMRRGVAIAAAGWLMAGSIHAQQPAATAQQQGQTEVDVAFAYDNAVRALQSGKFDEGLASVDPVIARHGQNALEEFGPVFGHFYYLRGMLLIKKGDFKGAVAPLKTCHEKFPRVAPPMKSGEDKPRLPNRYHFAALNQWAGCLLMLKQHAEGAVLFEKLLAECGNDPEIARAQAQINLAICYLHVPEKLEKGRDFLLAQIVSDAWTGTMKRRIFLALATEWTPHAPLAEIAPVLSDHAALLGAAPFNERMETLNPPIANLAAQALQSGDPLRALAWYRLVADPATALRELAEHEIEVKARRLPPTREPERQAMLDAMKKAATGYGSQLPPVLLGLGGAHYQIGDFAGSRAAYARLESLDPKLKDRPIVLHNLVVCSANLSLWQDVLTYGLKFFAEFPDHELRPSVARLMVEVLFVQQKYQEAYDVSRDTRGRIPEGDPMRDIVEFVHGAAAYHLEKFEESATHLEAYLATYPEAQRREPARYYIGAARVKLQQWPEAATALDGFLSDYPDSPLRPSALYLASLAHLVTENTERCQGCLDELQEKFPNSADIPASWNVRGDLVTALGGDRFEIAGAHTTARGMVEKEGRGEPLTAAYALRQLIVASSGAEEWAEAAGYFDAFQAKYSDSFWHTDTVIAALPALAETGRQDEAAGILESFVLTSSSAGPTPELDELFGTYATFITEHWTLPDALARFDAFRDRNTGGLVVLDAWLHTAKIEAMEKGDAKTHADAIRQAHFSLAALHEKQAAAVSNYCLVRLARWTLEERKDPGAARKIYDFILNERPYGEALGFALIEKAKINAASKDEAERQSALDTFRDAISRIDDPAMHQDAVLGIARILTADKKFIEAETEWKTYLDHRDWTRARAEANYSYALCLDQQGRKGDALKVYVSVYANFAGHLDWSTRAYLRAAAMLKEEGKDADALRVLQDMLKRMGHHDHPGVAMAKQTFTEWRAAYMATQSQTK
jgi:tetratricopeptide (TPR) repeat protein